VPQLKNKKQQATRNTVVGWLFLKRFWPDAKNLKPLCHHYKSASKTTPAKMTPAAALQLQLREKATCAMAFLHWSSTKQKKTINVNWCHSHEGDGIHLFHKEKNNNQPGGNISSGILQQQDVWCCLLPASTYECLKCWDVQQEYDKMYHQQMKGRGC